MAILQDDQYTYIKEITGRRAYEDESRDVGDSSTSQGMPKISRKRGGAGREVGNRSSLTAEGTNLTDTIS